VPEFTQEPVLAKTYISINPEMKSQFADWQANLNSIIAGQDGFVSLEFLSIDKPLRWVVITRFYNAEKLQAWETSSSNIQLMDELKRISLDVVKESAEDESSIRKGVTEVIITEVNPKQEKAYREWSAKVHQIEAKFSGFRGVYIQSPTSSQGVHWITLLQFDSPQNLDAWLQSTERKELLKESGSLISNLETHRVVSPYAGWFNQIGMQGQMSSVWQQTMLVLLVLFPIVVLELKYLNPLTIGLNLSLGTFIGNAISVALISFPMMPLVLKLLGWWLFPSNKAILFLGTFIVLALYAIEVALFWNFF
jgi:hypothetical protein